jgi:integrase
VHQRITRILDYATTRQYRAGDNPAAHVTEALPKPKNGKGHHAALPHNELPALMAELRERNSLSAGALEFTILTAARTGEVIGATWDEIDLKARTWTIPAERMKAGKEHKVPLCDRAVEILQGLDQRSKRLFPLSNMAMAELLKGLRPNVTVHGFRSTFMDWCHECTNHPKAVIDMALAHKVEDKVEAAYRRGDLFVKRIKLMAAWGQFCGKTPISSAVIALHKKA